MLYVGSLIIVGVSQLSLDCFVLYKLHEFVQQIVYKHFEEHVHV